MMEQDRYQRKRKASLRSRTVTNHYYNDVDDIWNEFFIHPLFLYHSTLLWERIMKQQQQTQQRRGGEGEQYHGDDRFQSCTLSQGLCLITRRIHFMIRSVSKWILIPYFIFFFLSSLSSFSRVTFSSTDHPQRYFKNMPLPTLKILFVSAEPFKQQQQQQKHHYHLLRNRNTMSSPLMHPNTIKLDENNDTKKNDVKRHQRRFELKEQLNTLLLHDENESEQQTSITLNKRRNRTLLKPEQSQQQHTISLQQQKLQDNSDDKMHFFKGDGDIDDEYYKGNPHHYLMRSSSSSDPSGRPRSTHAYQRGGASDVPDNIPGGGGGRGSDPLYIPTTSSSSASYFNSANNANRRSNFGSSSSSSSSTRYGMPSSRPPQNSYNYNYNSAGRSRYSSNNNQNMKPNNNHFFQPLQDWWTMNIQPNIKNWPKIQCRVEPTTTLKIRKTFRPLKTIIRISADFNTQLGVWQFQSSWEDAIIGGKLTLAGRELQFQKSWQLSVLGSNSGFSGSGSTSRSGSPPGVMGVEDLVTRVRFRAAVDLQTWKAYARVGFRTEHGINLSGGGSGTGFTTTTSATTPSIISNAFRKEGFAIRQQLPLDGTNGHVKLEVKANFILPEPEIEYSTETQRSLIGMGDIEVGVEELNLLLDY